MRPGFEDVPELVEELGGVFGKSEGLAEFNRVSSRANPDRSGFLYTCSCHDGCGRPICVSVTWEELLFWMHRVPPRGWQYDQQRGVVYPPVHCAGCHRPVRLAFTPDECGKRVRDGVTMGILPPDAVSRAAAQLTRR